MSFIPTLTEEEILKKIKDRDLEDLDLLADIEKNILKKRNHVVSPLKEGENVVLLLSGGLDSIIAWGLLLKHFKVNVYPFYLSRRFRAGEELSIYYFQHFFKNLAGYNRPLRYRISSQVFNFEHDISRVSPELVIHRYAPRLKTTLNPGTGASFLAVLFAGYYRMQLLWNHKIKVNKIISGITAIDGIEIHTQTHTYSRQLMSLLMRTFNDSDIEYYSLLLEKNLGLYLQKQDLIKIAKKLEIPFHLTFSCYRNYIWHCGKCSACKFRKNILNQMSDNKDKTFYFSQVNDFFRSLTPFLKVRILILYKLVRNFMKKYIKPIVEKIVLKASAATETGE